MAFPEETQDPRSSSTTSSHVESAPLPGSPPHPTDHDPAAQADGEAAALPAPYTPTVEDNYGYYEDSYGYDPVNHPGSPEPAPLTPVPAVSGSTVPPPPPDDEAAEDADDDGMLRMSFLDHLDELRRRLIYALIGVGISFVLSISFADDLWNIVQQPAVAALTAIGARPSLVFTKPTEVFEITWFKLPMLCAIFMSSPWLLYQVWSFVAPGLYKKERRLAAPFILASAGLFIAGGAFAYFVAFRFGLTFLLSIGKMNNIEPMVTVTEYFDLFVNVILGIAVVFELPVLVFFLTLLRITSPAFLMRNARYAILAIVVLAAVITPTPDLANLMVFSLPMIFLFFMGVFASYLLVLSRENKRFPWRLVAIVIGIPLALFGAALYVAVTRYGYHMVNHWPYLSK